MSTRTAAARDASPVKAPPASRRSPERRGRHARAASVRSASGLRRLRTRREEVLTILPFLMALAGAVVLGYPVVATLHNNTEQQRIADQYQARQDAAGPDALAAELTSAEAYNSTLESMPILDPWLETQRPDSPQYRAYLAELDDDTVMSQLVIPTIHVDLPVYHGTTSEVLAKGVGHLFGTSLPVGGAGTHAVLTGHTGLGSATLFDHLNDLEAGDVFYLNTAGRSLKYEVTDIRVVLPQETGSLGKVPGQDLVTLITCTPYGINTHRLLVTGTRVPLDPVAAQKEQEAATPAPMQTWMIWLICAVVLILVVLTVIAARMVWRRVRAERERKRRETPGPADPARSTSATTRAPSAAPGPAQGSTPGGARNHADGRAGPLTPV